jgi:hypothetical protein
MGVRAQRADAEGLRWVGRRRHELVRSLSFKCASCGRQASRFELFMQSADEVIKRSRHYLDKISPARKKPRS